MTQKSGWQSKRSEQKDIMTDENIEFLYILSADLLRRLHDRK